MDENKENKGTKSLTELYADFVVDLEYSKIPDEVLRKAKLLILDNIGIMAAGESFSIVKPAVDKFYDMGGKEESSVIGRKGKIPAPNAAFCNSLILHSLDFDDTHLRSGIHMSATAVPTALAIGELLQSTEQKLLEAIIAGYEIGARIGMATVMWRHRGFHPTSVIGTFIATTVASKLLGLSRDKLTSAYGITASFSSGILQNLIEGKWVKPFHPAWSSHGGIIAAELAKAGYEGPRNVLEGEHGLYNAFLYGDETPRRNFSQTLGSVWETLNISIKPYPSCHSTHSAIDATRKLRPQIIKEVDCIESITVYAPQLSFDLGLFEVGKEKPNSPYDAKFSIPYTVAVALLKDNPSIWDFTDDSINEEKYLKISKKVKGILDPEMEMYSAFDGRPARIVIKYNGKNIEEFVINHKGTPGNPLTEENIVDKFKDNLTKTKYKECTNRIINIVLGRNGITLSSLMGLLSNSKLCTN